MLSDKELSAITITQDNKSAFLLWAHKQKQELRQTDSHRELLLPEVRNLSGTI